MIFQPVPETSMRQLLPFATGYRKSASIPANISWMVEINGIIGGYVQEVIPGEGLTPSRQFEISKVDFALPRNLQSQSERI